MLQAIAGGSPEKCVAAEYKQSMCVCVIGAYAAAWARAQPHQPGVSLLLFSDTNEQLSESPLPARINWSSAAL